MAVSASIKQRERVPGAERRTVTEVTLDTEYKEKGEELTAKELGLTTVNFAHCVVKNGSEAEATTVGTVWYDAEKSILHVNDQKTQKEMAAGKNLEKVVVLVHAFGL